MAIATSQPRSWELVTGWKQEMKQARQAGLYSTVLGLFEVSIGKVDYAARFAAIRFYGRTVQPGHALLTSVHLFDK